MSRLLSILALAAVLLGSVALGADADDLAVARRALGDGLWQLAAKHAADAAAVAPSAEVRNLARLVQLEALAGAERADEMLSRLDAWQDATGEGFRYWRAWANLRSGKADVARTLLAAPFTTGAYPVLARRLLARLEADAGNAAAADAAYAEAAAALVLDIGARTENAVEWARAKTRFGDAAGALALLKKEVERETPGPAGDEARLLAADLSAQTGDAAGAQKLREALVAGGTNTDARAFVLASCALSESLLAAGATNDAVRVASNAVLRARQPMLAQQAGFALGFALFADPARRAEGYRQISALVRKEPDAPESAAAQLRLADGLLAVGDDAAAAREYEVLMQSFPGYALDSHVLEGRGWAFLRLGRRAEAVGLFARAAQVASNDVSRARCLFKQADALAADNRYDEAAATYGLVTNASYRSAAGFRRADALLRAKRPDEAAAAFKALRDGDDATAVEAGLRLAELEVSLGRHEDAIEAFSMLLGEKQVARLTPEQRAYALAGRGRAFYRAYRFREAEADFVAVGKLQSDRRDEMDFLAALCLYGDGREREAAAAARSLLTRLPDSPLRVDLQMWLATYDAGRREWPAAIDGFEACAKNERVPTPRRVDAFVRAARCAFELPDYQKALELAVGAITNATVSTGTTNVVAASDKELAAAAAEALVMQGEALSELGRFDDAELVLERAMHANGGETLQRRAALARANCYFVMGASDANRYRSAIEAYRAIQHDEGFSASQRLAASFNMARAFEKLRQLDEAADIYYTHVVLAYWNGVRGEEPGEASADGTSRRVWFDASARQYFSRAVYILADYWESRGELEQAIHMLDYLVRADLPAKDEAKRRITRLKEKGGLR